MVFDAQTEIQALQNELQQVRARLPAANSALIPHLTLPQYKGREDPRTFGGFIKELNRVGSAMGWNEAKLVQVLPCLISADALAIYDVLPDGVKTDWRQLTTEMGKRLNNQNDLTSALSKLLQRSQRAGESISEFAMAIRDLVRLAYTDAGGFDDDARKKWEILHFRRGLSPRIKLEVGRLPVPDSLDAAIAEAIAEADRQKDFQQDLMRNDQLVAAAQLQLNNQELRNEMEELRKHFTTLSIVRGPSKVRDHYRVIDSKTAPDATAGKAPGTTLATPGTIADATTTATPGTIGAGDRQHGSVATNDFSKTVARSSAVAEDFASTVFTTRNGAQNRRHFAANVKSTGSPDFATVRICLRHTETLGTNNEALRTSVTLQPSRAVASTLGMPFLTVLALVIALVAPAHAQFQLCPDNAGGHLISLPARQPCTPPPADIATPIQLELFLPRVTPTMVPAYRCQSITVEVCTRAIFGIIEAQWTKPSSLQPISVNDCWDTVKSGRFQNTTQLEQKDENTWSSNVPLTPDSKLFGQVCKNVTNYLTQKAEVGSLDGVHLSSSLGDLTGCRLDNHSCSRPHSVIVWESFPSRYLCTHESAGQYTGLMTRTHVLVGTLQAGFVFAHQPVPALLHSCLPSPLYAMLNEAVIRIIKPSTPVSSAPRRVRRNHALHYRVVSVGPPGAARRAYVSLNDSTSPAIYASQLPAGAIIHGGAITTLTDPSRMPIDMTTPQPPPSPPRPSPSTSSRRASTTSPHPTSTAQWPTTTPQPTTPTPSLASYDQWKLARQEKLRREKEQMRRDRQLAKQRELEEIRLRQQEAKTRELESAQQHRLSEKQRTLREQPWRVTPEATDTTPPPYPSYNREATTTETTTTSAPTAIPTPRAQLANDINTRLQYAIDEMQNSSLNEFRSLWRTICEQQNEQTAVINAITRFDATAGVRLLLRRDDVVAKWAGEALAVSACTPITPDEIFWSHQINATCYQNTPVRYQNKTFFIQAGTRELSTHAEPIPCNQRPMAVFKNATGGWNSQHGSAHVAALARDFRFHGFKQTLELSAPTTFNSDVTRVASTVTLLSAYVRRINNLERHLSNTLLLAEPTSSPADAVVKTVTENLNSIGNATTEAGSWFHDTLFSPISDTIREWATLVKITTALLLIIVILGLLLYTSPWWRPLLPRRPRFRRSTNQYVASVELQEILRQRPACLPSAPPRFEAESTYVWKPLTFIPPNCSLEYATAKDNMRYVEISLAGYTTHALLDTGSAVTVIRPSLARDIRYPFDRLTTPHCGKTMSGRPLQFLGTIAVDLSFGVSETPTRLLVAETELLPAPIIIGMDILLSFGKSITLDLPNNRLLIGGAVSPLLRAGELRPTTRAIPSSFGEPFRASTPSRDLAPPSPVDHLQRLLDSIDFDSTTTSTSASSLDVATTPSFGVIGPQETVFYATISVNGTHTRAMVDTGAVTSYCKISFTIEARLPFTACEGAAGRLPTGATTRVLGTSFAPLRWGALSSQRVLCVTANADLPADIVIGLDVLRDLNQPVLLRLPSRINRRPGDNCNVLTAIPMPLPGHTTRAEASHQFRHQRRQDVRWVLEDVLEDALAPVLHHKRRRRLSSSSDSGSDTSRSTPRCSRRRRRQTTRRPRSSTRRNIGTRRHRSDSTSSSASSSSSPRPPPTRRARASSPASSLRWQRQTPTPQRWQSRTASPVHSDSDVVMEASVVNTVSSGINAVAGETGRLMYIQLNLNGIPVRTLVDSGASISYAQESVAATAGLIVDNASGSLTAQAANGSSINFLGRAPASLQFGDTTVDLKLLVSKDSDCPAPLLLGMDVLRGLNQPITFDFSRNSIRTPAEEIALIAGVLATTDDKPIPTYIAETVIIPARSDNVIKARIARTFPCKTELLLSERPNEYPALMVGRCLVCPGSSKQVAVRIFNTSNGDITVYAGSRIAHLEFVDAQHTSEPLFPPAVVNHVTAPNNDEAPALFRTSATHLDAFYTPPEVDDDIHLPPVSTKCSGKPISSKLNLDGCTLSPAGMTKFMQIIEECADAFVGEDGQIGCFNGPVKMKIDLKPGAKPVQRRPYRVPLARQPVVKQQIDELLAKKYIRPSTSPLCSPIVLINKKDGGTRFAVDYRALNEISVQETYIMPIASDIHDAASGHRYYTSLDMQSAYWQLEMHPDSVEKTAFGTFCGLYEWLRCPFGLKSAPAVFQRVMEFIRQQVTSCCLVYLDDILIASDTEQQHLADIRQILKVLIRHNFRLRIDKCRFAQDSAKYLGFRIGEHGMELDAEEIDAVKKLKPPKNSSQLRSFVGLINYYRRFIPGLAAICKCLYDLMNADKYEWTDVHQKAFDTLVNFVTTAPVLAPPRTDRPFRIETDASSTALAGCLYQQDDQGEWHPVAFASRLCNKHEANYSSFELETLALVFAVKKFGCYIQGAGTTECITDNSAVTSLLRRRDLTGRLARFQMALQPYDLKIVHRAGKNNAVADYLSRWPHDLPDSPQPTSSVNATITPDTPAEPVDYDTLQQEQRAVTEYAMLIDGLENDQWPADLDRRHQLQTIAQNYVMLNDLLHFHDIDNEDDPPRIVVPYALRARLIRFFHEDPLHLAHLGIAKTFDKIRQRFYWPGLSDDVSSTVRACGHCQHRKTNSKQMATEPMHPLPVAQFPFDRVHVDVLTLPLTPRKNRYVLSCVCAFSKWIIAVAIPDQTATTICQQLTDHLITLHSCPRTMVTDNGPSLVGNVMNDFCRLYAIKHITITPYNPPANGLVERQNSTIAAMLSAYCSDDASSWDLHLSKSPFFVLCGRDATLPSDLALRIQPRQLFADCSIYIQEQATRLRSAWNTARSAIEAAQHRQKDFADTFRRAEEHQFNMHQLVLVYEDQPPKHRDHKLRQKYIGPLRIIGIRRPNLIVTELDTTTPRTRTVLMNRAKPFIGPATTDASTPSTTPTTATECPATSPVCPPRR
ncbi:pol polyprotein [Aphelenchoides avenae]|nr:pol polyprotein [Aphelenchus avenae]